MPLGHPAAALERCVEQGLNGVAGGRRDPRVMVIHTARQSSAVVDEVELASEATGSVAPACSARSVNMARIQALNWSAACSTDLLRVPRWKRR